MARLSIVGMLAVKPDLLDALHYPAGLDGETLKNNIYLECAELDVLYTDPDFFAAAINHWSAKELPVWEHLYETTQYEYNPIWNKDGTIKERLTETRDLAHEESAARGIVSSGSEESNATSIHSVNAFNAGAFTDQSKDVTSGSVTSNDRTDDDVKSGGTDTGTITHERETIEQGNIGVTTTQQMIQQERELAAFNIYDHIATSFKNRFCLLLY